MQGLLQQGESPGDLGASGHGGSQGIACWQRPSPARRAAAGGLGYVLRSTDRGASLTYLATTPRTSTSIAFVTASRWLELVVPSQPDETLDAGHLPVGSDGELAARKNYA